MIKHVALAFALTAALDASARPTEDSIVLAGRIFPSGDFIAIVTADMRIEDMPAVDRSGATASLDPGRSLASALARIQMRSNVRVERPLPSTFLGMIASRWSADELAKLPSSAALRDHRRRRPRDPVQELPRRHLHSQGRQVGA